MWIIPFFTNQKIEGINISNPFQYKVRQRIANKRYLSAIENHNTKHIQLTNQDELSETGSKKKNISVNALCKGVYIAYVACFANIAYVTYNYAANGYDSLQLSLSITETKGGAKGTQDLNTTEIREYIKNNLGKTKREKQII
ncbi:8481_t:CDS:2, partial [Gigaspora rosea]